MTMGGTDWTKKGYARFCPDFKNVSFNSVEVTLRNSLLNCDIVRTEYILYVLCVLLAVGDAHCFRFVPKYIIVLSSIFYKIFSRCIGL